MEVVSLRKIRKFLTFCGENNMQVLLNRRTGLNLLNDALEFGDGEHTVEVPVDNFDKLITYLSLVDDSVHSAGGQVNVYAFVRIISALRRDIRRRFGPTPAPTPTPPGGGDDQAPSPHGPGPSSGPQPRASGTPAYGQIGQMFYGGQGGQGE